MSLSPVARVVRPLVTTLLSKAAAQMRLIGDRAALPNGDEVEVTIKPVKVPSIFSVTVKMYSARGNLGVAKMELLLRELTTDYPPSASVLELLQECTSDDAIAIPMDYAYNNVLRFAVKA